MKPMAYHSGRLSCGRGLHCTVCGTLIGSSGEHWINDDAVVCSPTCRVLYTMMEMA